jgi:hypothetical protein
MMEEKMKDENGVVSSVSKIVLDDDLYSRVTTDLSSSLSSCIDTLSRNYYYDSFYPSYYRDFVVKDYKDIIEESKLFVLNDLVFDKIKDFTLVDVQRNFDQSSLNKDIEFGLTALPEAWVSEINLFVKLTSKELMIFADPGWYNFLGDPEDILLEVRNIVSKVTLNRNLDYMSYNPLGNNCYYNSALNLAQQKLQTDVKA